MSQESITKPKEWELTLKGPDGSVLVITAASRAEVCTAFVEESKPGKAPAYVFQ